MKKQLQIISATHAREINIWEKPFEYAEEFSVEYEKVFKRWQQAESSLKEYRIECYGCDGDGVSIDLDSNRIECPIHITYPIGSIHECETNEELNTCVIL